MSEDNTAALMAALQQQMAALAASHAQAPVAAPPTAWGVPAPAPVQIAGVSIPIKYQTPLGSVKVLLTLPAECAASPMALDLAIQSIMALGFEIDAWKPKEQNGWGGNRNGGGWRR